jgi:multiple sugar transport system substrate-binding protein
MSVAMVFAVRIRVVACAAAALALAGAVRAQQPVEITFANWAAAEPTTRPAIEQVIKDFEAAHPDIRIKSEAISFSEIARQLVLRVRSGNPPDVAQIAGNDTFLLAVTGKLEPLDGYVDADLKAAMKPHALEQFRYQGKQIALPWTQAPAGLWYNKALMRKAGLDPENPPKTIDALMTALAAIKRTQPDVIALGLDTTNRAFALQSNWAWIETFGANPIGEGSKGADTPQMRAYLAWMRDLAKNGYIDPGRRIGEFRPLAAQDKVAFIWDQVLLQGVMQAANKMSDADFYQHWGVTTLPVGPTGKASTFEGGHQAVIFADSKQKKAAWTFARYLAASPEAMRTYTLGAGASLPALARITDPELARKLDTPVYNAFAAKIVPTVSPPPFGAAFASGATAVMAGVQQAVGGNEPIDAIAKSIQQQLAKQ